MKVFASLFYSMTIAMLSVNILQIKKSPKTQVAELQSPL